ncbi:MAG TPA: hypothetical protein VNW92_30085 [Polyangiaceae bacterium]|nr:hypothetical protein [Polyangiaceae bacterium]
MASSRKWGAQFSAGLALGAALSFTSVARAEPSAADKETARSLLDDGDQKLENKDFAGALKSYQSAHAIMNVPSTGIEVAKTLVRLGRLVEARDTALSVSRMPKSSNEPRAFGQARTEAEGLASELAARIPSLELKVSGAAPGQELHVTIDGAAVPPAVATVPRKLDPGKHQISISSAGRSDLNASVELKEGEKRTLELALTSTPAAAPAAPVAAAPSPVAPAPVAPAAPAPAEPRSAAVPESKSGVSSLAYIGFGIGAVGVGVGTVTGLMSLSKASTAKKFCTGNDCTPAASDDINSSKSLANVSNVGFAVGIVGLGLGVYGLLSSGHAPEATQATARHWDVLLGARSVGVAGAF